MLLLSNVSCDLLNVDYCEPRAGVSTIEQEREVLLERARERVATRMADPDLRLLDDASIGRAVVS
jgi:hypothetical protein